VNQNPLPSVEQWLLFTMPNFAALLWAIPVARHVHGLSVQVERERAMGSYRLKEKIGSGGMGEVWRAEHRLLARPAAVKVIRPEALEGRERSETSAVLQRRFEREARATAALRSPHTVALYDYGTTDDGRFYYAMELLDGLDLEALVREHGAQPPARAVHLLKQVCLALAEAHENGLVHRDIKPRNLFMCRLGVEYDFLKVLDFGVAKHRFEGDPAATQLTTRGLAIGTPAYMAPEAALGSVDPDPRMDLYSLGCVAYWLLTGQEVFGQDTPVAAVLAHLQNEPIPPSRRSGRPIPAALDEIVLRCLSKSPDERPQSALELYNELTDRSNVPVWSTSEARRWWASERRQGAPILSAQLGGS
jgi:serine/threonine-protein kinase